MNVSNRTPIEPSSKTSEQHQEVFNCQICGHQTSHPNKNELGSARGNTARFLSTVFKLWQCPSCKTIYATDSVQLEEIYKDYPLNKRQLDIFARGTLGNLLRRLERAGLQKHDSVLDYGCGNGIFIHFLKS